MEEGKEEQEGSAAEETTETTETSPATETQQAGGEPTGFFAKYGGKLLLIGFIIYFSLLVTGVIAEIFDIEWILDWWIWRPPGKPPGNY